MKNLHEHHRHNSNNNNNTNIMANSENTNEVFEAATEFVVANTSSIDADTLLKLYSRYKQVKIGQCSTPKPGFFDFQGKQKWESWKKLGNMTKDCAMREYIELVSKHNADWRAESTKPADKNNSGKQMSLGVAVSTMMNTDDTIDDDLKTIFDWCKEGQTKRVSQMLARNTVNIDEKDSDGMALLHWACDRGNTQMVNTLLKHGANTNIQDADGQTGLHFAVICEHPEVVKLLLNSGARTDIADIDGQTIQSMISETTVEIQQIISSFPVR